MTLRMNLVLLSWEGVAGSTSYDILLNNVKVAQAGPRARTTKITIPEGSEQKVTIKAQPSGLLQEAKFQWSSISPAPIGLVSSSIVAGQSLTGIVPWVIQTSGPVASVEFWSDDKLLGSDTSPPSPFTFQLDTTSFPDGQHALGVAIIGTDGSRITPQIGTVQVSNGVTPPPPGDLLWNADLSTGNISQYGDWEWGGTFDGTPPLSERVAVAQSLDGYTPAQGNYLMRIKVAPGDQYGGSTGWRTIARLPPEYSNPLGYDIILRNNGYDSAYTWAVLVPPGYPFDSNEWLTGPEWHHTGAYINVAPCHFTINNSNMRIDVAGNVNGAAYRQVYLDEHILNGYEQGKWYVFTARYKHGVAPDGIFELWYGKKGQHTTMQQLYSLTGIGTMYKKPDLTYDPNYMLFGSYRGQSGSAVTTSYWGGYREYSTAAGALAWANQILNAL